MLKTQDCEPSLITQQRALERSGLSAAPAARTAPSIDEESPSQDINRTPEQCSTGFEWSNKSSTLVDSEIEAWSASSPPSSASEDNEFAQFEPSTSVSSLIKEATEGELPMIVVDETRSVEVHLSSDLECKRITSYKDIYRRVF